MADAAAAMRVATEEGGDEGDGQGNFQVQEQEQEQEGGEEEGGEEEDLTCPLCIEEMDMSDRNFKPCPCGYQVCQFCWNHIRTNLNGNCPACRRPYSEQTAEFKVISSEEYRAEKEQRTRAKRQQQQQQQQQQIQQLQQQQQQPSMTRQKDGEVTSRRHLQNIRVIQKNLVYVIGLSPKLSNDDLLPVLRGSDFFGQYGKIQKIVVNKHKPSSNINASSANQGVGVYVTYVSKEDASKAIEAIDGSINEGGKVLRASHGTTKYCTSYLRNQPCSNPTCMYLHEPGDDLDSYTREDLSTYQHAAKQKQGEPMARPVMHPKSALTVDDAPSLPRPSAWGRTAAASASAQQKSSVVPTRSQSADSQDSKNQTHPISMTPRPQPSATGSLEQALQLFNQGSFQFSFSKSIQQSKDYRAAQNAAPWFRFDKEAAFQQKVHEIDHLVNVRLKSNGLLLSKGMAGGNNGNSSGNGNGKTSTGDDVLRNGNYSSVPGHGRTTSRFGFANERPLPMGGPTPPSALTINGQGQHIGRYIHPAGSSYKTSTPPGNINGAPSSSFEPHADALDGVFLGQSQRRPGDLSQPATTDQQHHNMGFGNNSTGGASLALHIGDL